MGDRAYILAKSKNIYEDTKLRKQLKQIEKDRLQSTAIINVELAEERRICAKLKREAKEIEMRRKRAERMREKARSMRRMMNFKGGLLKLFQSKKKEDDQLDLPRDYKLAPTIMLPKIGSRSNTQASPAVSREPSNVDNTQQGKKTLKLPSINKTVSVQDPPSRQPTQTDIPAANIFQALSNQNTDLSSLKPKKRDNTLEGLKKIADKLRPKKEQKKKLWPGDPAAVGSIRRPRKTAQEMASMLTAATKVLQTNRELLALQTCTKNCQRKYQVDETLLPKEAPPTLSSIMKKYREMNRPPRKAKSMGDLPNLSDSTVSLAASEPALTKGKLELSKGFFASITKKEPGSNLLTIPKDQPQGQVTEGQGQVQKNDLNPRPVLPSIQETPAKKPAAAGGLMAMLKNMKAANAASGAAPIEVQ